MRFRAKRRSLKSLLDQENKAILCTVIVASILGLYLGDIVYDFPKMTPEGTIPYYNNTIIVNTQNEWESNMRKLENGKIRENSLLMKEGYTERGYWESTSFRIDNPDQLKVYVDIPGPSKSKVFVDLRTSYIPDFGDNSGYYSIKDRTGSWLSDGENKIDLYRNLNGEYYRIVFKMSREDSSVDSPRIRNYTLEPGHDWEQ